MDKVSHSGVIDPEKQSEDILHAEIKGLYFGDTIHAFKDTRCSYLVPTYLVPAHFVTTYCQLLLQFTLDRDKFL